MCIQRSLWSKHLDFPSAGSTKLYGINRFNFFKGGASIRDRRKLASVYEPSFSSQRRKNGSPTKKIENWSFSSELDRNWIKFFDLRWHKWKKIPQRRLEKSKSRDCFACCLIGAKIWLERLSSNVKALTWTRKLINRSLNFSSSDLQVEKDH